MTRYLCSKRVGLEFYRELFLYFLLKEGYPYDIMLSSPTNFRTSCRVRVDLGTNSLLLERTQHTYFTCSYCGVTVLLFRLLVAGLSLRRPGNDPSSLHVGFMAL